MDEFVIIYLTIIIVIIFRGILCWQTSISVMIHQSCDGGLISTMSTSATDQSRPQPPSNIAGTDCLKYDTVATEAATAVATTVAAAIAVKVHSNRTSLLFDLLYN